MNLNLNLTVDETKGVLEALQRFPMNQVRALVSKIENQANEQTKPKVPEVKEMKTPASNEQVLSEVKPPVGEAV